MVKSLWKNSSYGNQIINNSIFNELIKRRYSLEGKNRVYNIADSKLWCLTPDQAKAFIDLEEKDSKQKMFINKEINLLRGVSNMINTESNKHSLNIIDLGCGNGKKALVLINSFKDKSKIRYCPVDANSFMVDQAIKTISRVKSIDLIKSKQNNLDLLDLDEITSKLKKGKFKTNLLLLLGGSLENFEVHELLHNIRSAMKEDDILLIGNKLTHPSKRKMIAYYQNNRRIEDLVFKTIEQLGFRKDEIKYGVRFRGSRIEMLYTLLKDKTIQSKGKKVNLRKGDKIVIIISYKYNRNQLMETLNLYFNNVELMLSPHGSYALALCKK